MTVANLHRCHLTGANDNRAEDHFGLCPVCHKNDGYLNLNRSHVFRCIAHRKGWVYGSNIFSGWREESEADWERNAKELERYQKVEPFFWPETLAEAKAYTLAKAEEANWPEIDEDIPF